MARFDIIEYMSGLTTFVMDDSVLKAIAYERDVMNVTSFDDLSEMTRDLLTADILYRAYCGAANIPSFQHQHGQFSTSTGAQNIADKDTIGRQAYWLYRKWGDDKMFLIPQSSLNWME